MDGSFFPVPTALLSPMARARDAFQQIALSISQGAGTVFFVSFNPVLAPVNVMGSSVHGTKCRSSTEHGWSLRVRTCLVSVSTSQAPSLPAMVRVLECALLPYLIHPYVVPVTLATAVYAPDLCALHCTCRVFPIHSQQLSASHRGFGASELFQCAGVHSTRHFPVQFPDHPSVRPLFNLGCAGVHHEPGRAKSGDGDCSGGGECTPHHLRRPAWRPNRPHWPLLLTRHH